MVNDDLPSAVGAIMPPLEEFLVSGETGYIVEAICPLCSDLHVYYLTSPWTPDRPMWCKPTWNSYRLVALPQHQNALLVEERQAFLAESALIPQQLHKEREDVRRQHVQRLKALIAELAVAQPAA